MQIIELVGKTVKESKFMSQVIKISPVYLKLFGTIILKSFLNTAYRFIGCGPIIALIPMPVPIPLSGVHMGTLKLLA